MKLDYKIDQVSRTLHYPKQKKFAQTVKYTKIDQSKSNPILAVGC